jgi:ERCC4-type nuclease
MFKSVQVEVVNLPIGDTVIVLAEEEKVIVERKSLRDYELMN